MVELRCSLLESPHSLDLERFHATEDKQTTRNQVFSILKRFTPEARFDAVIVDKRKAHPTIQSPEKLFPMVIKWLLSYVVAGYSGESISEVIFVTDSIPVGRNKKAIVKGIKTSLAETFGGRIKYTILHWASSSCMSLQAADYMTWAMHKKWTQSDLRPYNEISAAVKSEFDVFRRGTFKYY